MNGSNEIEWKKYAVTPPHGNVSFLFLSGFCSNLKTSFTFWEVFQYY